jgi:hypothetical protein
MKQFKKFLPLFFLSLVGYSLGLAALNLYYDKTSPFKYLLILLPMAPTFYVIFISVRAASQFDEMQRRIVTEAMAFSGLATALTCMGYNFCRDMGAPEFKAYWAWSLVGLYYFVGLAWAKRRYR